MVLLGRNANGEANDTTSQQNSPVAVKGSYMEADNKGVVIVAV